MVATSRLKVLTERVKNPAFALNAVGTMLASRARASFAAQRRGAPWLPRAVPNVLGILADLEAGRSPSPKRFEPRPALVDTGALRASIRYRVVGRTRLEVSASAPYATLMRRGGVVTRPVRPDVLRGLAALLRERPELRDKLGWLFTWARRGRSVRVRVPARDFLTPTPKDLRDARAVLSRALLRG